MTIIIPNETNTRQLCHVAAKMRSLGPPAIRATWSDYLCAWIALEGSHRLTAAHALGLRPIIVEQNDDDGNPYGPRGLSYKKWIETAHERKALIFR